MLPQALPKPTALPKPHSNDTRWRMQLVTNHQRYDATGFLTYDFFCTLAHPGSVQRKAYYPEHVSASPTSYTLHARPTKARPTKV